MSKIVRQAAHPALKHGANEKLADFRKLQFSSMGEKAYETVLEANRTAVAQVRPALRNTGGNRRGGLGGRTHYRKSCSQCPRGPGAFLGAWRRGGPGARAGQGKRR